MIAERSSESCVVFINATARKAFKREFNNQNRAVFGASLCGVSRICRDRWRTSG